MLLAAGFVASFGVEVGVRAGLAFSGDLEEAGVARLDLFKREEEDRLGGLALGIVEADVSESAALEFELFSVEAIDEGVPLLG